MGTDAFHKEVQEMQAISTERYTDTTLRIRNRGGESYLWKISPTKQNDEN